MIKNNILNIMNKQKKFNASDINEIFNVFFKTIRKSFTELKQLSSARTCTKLQQKKRTSESSHVKSKKEVIYY